MPDKNRGPLISRYSGWYWDQLQWLNNRKAQTGEDKSVTMRRALDEFMERNPLEGGE